MSLAGLTPEQMAMTPAGAPPPGVIPNLIDPYTDRNLFLILGTVFLVIMLIFAGLRLYTKLVVTRSWAWDDVTCAIAVIGAIFYYAICCVAVTIGKIGTHLWDISLAHLLSDQFQIPGFLANWFTTLVWMFTKSSFFLLYLQIFWPFIWLRRMIYFGLFVNVAFYISILIVTLYYTTPAPGESFAELFTTPRYFKTINTTIPIASGSLVLDVYIFLLPMFGVYKLALSNGKKVGVMLVFAAGLAACVASSLAVYYKYQLDHHSADFSYRTLPILLMSFIEMAVGISASCMPALSKLIRNGDGWIAFRSKLSQTFSSLLNTGKSDSTKEATSGTEEVSRGPYSNIEETKSSVYEMDQMKSVRTDIKSGSSSLPDQDNYGVQLIVSMHQEVTQA